MMIKKFTILLSLSFLVSCGQNLNNKEIEGGLKKESYLDEHGGGDEDDNESEYLTYEEKDFDYNDETYDKRIAEYNKMNNERLSSTQQLDIKSYHRSIGEQFRAIGQDPTLTGREKGILKRQLAIQRRQGVQKILNNKQITSWESTNPKYNKVYDQILEIETKIDKLEDQYDYNEDVIKHSNISDYEKKARKRDLKLKFKTEKRNLKLQKEKLKNQMYIE